MKNFKLRKKTYQIPNSWMDINLKTFLEIKKHEALVDTMSLTEYNIRFLSIITNIDYDELAGLTPNELTNMYQEIIEITKEEFKMVEDLKIDIDGISYSMENEFNKMRIAQFIDLDYILKRKDVWGNAHEITACFLREVKQQKYFKRFFKSKLVKYNHDEMIKRSHIFLEKMPMPFIYTCVTFFFTGRTKLRQIFEGLFPIQRDVIPDEKQEPLTPEQEYTDKWTWYSTIRGLANGDLTRFEEILDLDLITVFNDLSYQKETDNYKRYLNKENTKRK